MIGENQLARDACRLVSRGSPDTHWVQKHHMCPLEVTARRPTRHHRLGSVSTLRPVN